MFGFQPQFAKPKIGSHSLVGMCLVFATLWLATLYCPYGPLVIETIFLPTFAKVWRPISQPYLCGWPHFGLATLVSNQTDPTFLCVLGLPKLHE